MENLHDYDSEPDKAFHEEYFKTLKKLKKKLDDYLDAPNPHRQPKYQLLGTFKHLLYEERLVLESLGSSGSVSITADLYGELRRNESEFTFNIVSGVIQKSRKYHRGAIYESLKNTNAKPEELEFISKGDVHIGGFLGMLKAYHDLEESLKKDENEDFRKSHPGNFPSDEKPQELPDVLDAFFKPLGLRAYLSVYLGAKMLEQLGVKHIENKTTVAKLYNAILFTEKFQEKGTSLERNDIKGSQLYRKSNLIAIDYATQKEEFETLYKISVDAEELIRKLIKDVQPSQTGLNQILESIRNDQKNLKEKLNI